MYTVYILISERRKNWSYVGYSADLERRVNEHRRGRVRSTKGNRPLLVIYTETFDIEDEAYQREQYLKSGIGREEKQRLIQSSRIV